VNARAHLPHVLELVAAGRLDPTPVTSARVTWENAIEGLLEGGTKPIIVRDGAS
jgi:alcohol dehydrogenase